MGVQTVEHQTGVHSVNCRANKLCMLSTADGMLKFHVGTLVAFSVECMSTPCSRRLAELYLQEACQENGQVLNKLLLII